MPQARPARLFVAFAVVLVAATGLSLRWWSTAEPPQTLRVGLGPWIGYEPLVAARESGALPAAVRLVELGSNTEAIDAFEEGRLDAAGLTLDESLRLAREGTPHSIVAVLSDSRGGDAVLGRPPHASVADLAGGVVLVEDTAGGQFVLGAALEDAGVPRSAVEVRRVQATRLPVAWANGEAAGVVAHSPLVERLQAEGATLLFSTRDHPGLVLDVLVLREGLSPDDPAVRALFEAWDAGHARLAALDEPLATVLARGLGMDAAAYREALTRVALVPSAEGRAMLAGDPPPIAASIERVERLIEAAPGTGTARPRLDPGTPP